MAYRWFRNPKVLILTPLKLILLFLIACGESAAPTLQPSPTATSAPAQVVVAGETPVSAPTATPTATPAPAAGAQAAVDRLRIATLNPHAETYDPALTTAGSGAFQFRMMYESLLRFDQQGAYIPNLATSWEISSDLTTWTLHLKKGVPFHRGFGEFGVPDFIHTLEQELRPEGIVGWKDIYQNWMDDLEVPDDHTLVLHLDPKMFEGDVLLYLSNELGVAIRSQAHFEAEGQQGVLRTPVGTGPYQAVERLEGSHVLYERVPYDHHRVNPDFQELQLLFAAESATRLAMVVTGQAHAVFLSPDLRNEAESQGMKTIRSTIVTSPNYMMFGGNYLPSKPHYDPTVPLTNKKVRQALNLAVDRQGLRETLFGGEGEIMVMPFFHPNYLGWDPALAESFKEDYRYDPQRAKELLVEAGYPSGFKTTIALVPRPGLPNILDVGEAIGQYWEAIGVDVELKPFEFAAMRPHYREETMHNISWIDSTARFAQLEFTLRVLYYSKGVVHFFETDFIDEKYEEVATTFSSEGRDRIGREIINHLYDEYAMLPLFWTFTVITVDPTVIAEWETTAAPFFPADVEYVVAVKQ